MTHRAKSSALRAAFTLIELLVVIGLMIVIASLALLFTPRMAEDQRVSRGADQISGWLLIAKQRSFRDQVPRGVRLIPSADNPNWVRELVYIERPEDLRGSQLVVPGQGAQMNTAFIPGATWFQDDIVVAGDFLQMNAHENAPYNVHRIAAVTPFNHPQFGAGTLLRLAAADGTASNISGRINESSGGASPGLYQIVRRARPLAGEPTLPLPRDVIIDIDPATEGSSVLTSLDIMFTERGQVLGSSGSAGKIILRVRPSEKPANPVSQPNHVVYDQGDQYLLTVYTRTGLIAAHPVDNTLNPNPKQPAPPAGTPWLTLDPYRFTRDGNTSGF